MNKKSTLLTFEVMDYEFLLTIGLDTKKHASTDKTMDPRTMTIKRTSDRTERVLQTYLSESNPLREIIRLFIVPIIQTTSLLRGENRRPPDMRPLKIARRLHALPHVHPYQLKRICKEAIWATTELERQIRHVSTQCARCVRSGTPKLSNKLSVRHINDEFNQKYRRTFFRVKGIIYQVIHFVDVSKVYSEERIVNDRKIETFIMALEQLWICRHGVTVAFSAVDEFNRHPSKKLLRGKGIIIKLRPARRHNEIDVIERKMGL